MNSYWLVLILWLAQMKFIKSYNEQPNIITILIDDLGWNDLGFHGSNQIPTPNIDALAYSGTILNRHYVLPTCTPSRTALMTGTYPIRTGMQGYPMMAGEPRAIPTSVKLLPQYLKDLGYKAHMVGKWHLGYMTKNHIPVNRGFDTFYGYFNGYMEYFDYGLNQSLSLNGTAAHFYGYDMHINDHVDWTNRGQIYATRAFTSRALEIIEQHNQQDPLYLYFSHLAVHTGTSEGTGLEVPDDMDVDQTYSYIQNKERRLYAGMVEELDTSIGAVVKALQDTNMLNNSIILVMSDNGAQSVSADMQPNWGSNWPLRGTKFTMYEGGVRGSALIWARHLPQGIVSDQFVHISDWLPTFYSAAGGSVADLPELDGSDLWRALQDAYPYERDHVLLNIDEAEHAEGIILHDRWKVVKGGLRKYANYDHHWGAENNYKAAPEYNITKIRESQAGRSIRSLVGTDNILEPHRMLLLRREAQVSCSKPENMSKEYITREVSDGMVDLSTNFRCLDYCLFDIINDPCEYYEINDQQKISQGVELLKIYEKQVVPQANKPVDPNSNPALRDGVWSPWAKSQTVQSAPGLHCVISFLLFFLLTLAVH